MEIVGKPLRLETEPPLLEFTSKNGEKSYFDFVDGSWKFWGDVSVDESAKELFKALEPYLNQYHKCKSTNI